MRNLGELKLSDAKVMDTHEMKAVTGGQMGISSNCRNTGSSSGVGGDTSDIRCEGDCLVVGDVTGTGKQPAQFRKSIFVLILLLFSPFIHSQITSFHVNGKVDAQYNDKLVILSTFTGDSIRSVDSTYVIDGHFSF